LIGDWTVREIIAHIAAWDREVLHGLEDVLAGRRVRYADWDEDEFNRTVARRVVGQSWESIRADAVAANAALCTRIREVKAQYWERAADAKWPDGSRMTPASVLLYTYLGGTHYAGHAAELEAAR
jgi:hypothetical protein